MEFKSITGLLFETIERKKESKGLFFKNRNQNWVGITYSEFRQMIMATASVLIDSEITKNDNICIFSQNMPSWSVVDFAIQCCNAVSVPIYPTASVGQVAYIINETEAKIVFAGEQEQYDKTVEAASGLKCLEKIVVFDDTVRLNDKISSVYFKDFFSTFKDNPHEEKISQNIKLIQADDILTILYTSGTTGEPKGVMLTHECFAEIIRIHILRLTLREDEISLAFLPLSHIFERGWTTLILLQGYQNYFLLNPKEIIDEIKIVRPTIMCTVPRFFEKTYAAVLGTVENFSALKKNLFNWAIGIGFLTSEKKRLEQKIPFSLKLKYILADTLVLKKGRSVFGGRIRFMPTAGAALQDDINRFFHAAGIDVKYGYGLTETTATVSCFTDTGFIYGSVGKLMPEIKVKIGENEEILINSKTVMKGYYKKPEETANLIVDGWFKTGDAGSIDDQGNLYMKERIKDIIKTSSGKFVAPQMIETLVGNDPYINQIAVIGDERKYISALIVPVFENLTVYARMNGISFNNINELINHPEIKQFYQSRLDKKQEQLAGYEQIKKFRLLENDFSIDSGELTPTLKVKRKIVAEIYRKEIEELYD